MATALAYDCFVELKKKKKKKNKKKKEKETLGHLSLYAKWDFMARTLLEGKYFTFMFSFILLFVLSSFFTILFF